MSIEDDLETDVASLKRELLDFILTEIRSGHDRQSLAGAPLAQDLVDVVRGGLQGAADDAAQRIENQRAEVLVRALGPAFERVAGELRALREAVAAAETRRSAAAPAAGPGVDRTDEVLTAIRRLGAPAGPSRREGAAQRGAVGGLAIGLIAGALVIGAAGGWLAGGSLAAPRLAPETAVADQAHQLQAALSQIAGAPTPAANEAPKIDPQTIAGDLGDVTAALEQAANATTPDALAAAHQQALAAVSQLKGVLDFDRTSHPAQPSPSPSPSQPPPTQPTTPPPRPTPAPVQHTQPHPHPPAPTHPASTAGSPPPAPSTSQTAPPSSAPPSSGSPAPPSGGAH